MAAGPIAESMKWSANAEDWYSHEHDDTHLVFFRPSADSHFLNFLSFGALKLLSEAIMTTDDLAHRLREVFSLTEAELPVSLVKTVVEQLDDAGMIKPEMSA